jgi:uncharacterized protein YjiS (DUF1127 family)
MTATTLSERTWRPKAMRAAGLFSVAMDTVYRWHASARDRRALVRLSDHALRDIGISRMDIASELYAPSRRS